jgi:hypothetical protein
MKAGEAFSSFLFKAIFLPFIIKKRMGEFEFFANNGISGWRQGLTIKQK